MKLLLLLFLIGNFQNAISKENSDDIEGGRNFPITVSIVSLLSNPEDYAESHSCKYEQVIRDKKKR